jgi:hypothetical protein
MGVYEPASVQGALGFVQKMLVDAEASHATNAAMRQKHLYPILFILMFGTAGVFTLSEIIGAHQTVVIRQTLNIASPQ